MVGYILSGILLLILAAVLVRRYLDMKRLDRLSEKMEDYLTITESDARIRNYFSLNYSVERSGDVITVSTDSDSVNSKCYFILRTHDEKINSVSGGKFTKIEENAYLITTERNKCEIKLSSTLSALVDMEGSNR